MTSASHLIHVLTKSSTVNIADSSTYANVSTPAPLRLSYVDGSTVNGTYASDKVTVAGATIDKFVFAVAHELQVSPNTKNGPQYGIMGLSYEGGESSICASEYYSSKCNINFTTPTIPDGLYAAGYIKSRSYSLYLDDVAAKSGSILFGGVDTAKFTGELVTLGVPVNTRPQNTNDGIYAYQDLYLTSLSGKINGTTAKFTPSNYSSTVILDSGNPGMGLPPSIFKQVLPYLPVVEQNGFYGILCKDADKIDASIIVELTGTNGKSVTIEVPFANFVVPAYKGNYNSTTPYQYGGEDACVVAIYSDAKEYSNFGDPFLRSVYAFNDLDAHTVSLAQASYDTTGSSITAVGQGPVPSFTGTGKPPSGPSKPSVSASAPSSSPSTTAPSSSPSPTPNGSIAVSMTAGGAALSTILVATLLVGLLW